MKNPLMADVLIEAKDIGKRFADTAWAVRGVDFAWRTGELVVLAGRNGAGKTVLAKMLAGLIDPSEGALSFKGKAFCEYRDTPAARIGYVFQDARLQFVGETVEEDVLFGTENLGMPRDQAAANAEQAIERCGLGPRRGAFVHTLSGGEQRRLAIAGMLALRPRALILDEPFANLDREGVSSVLRIVVDSAASGISVLVVTHEIEKVLGLADRLLVMEGGHIVIAGEPEAALAEGVERFGLRDPLRSIESIRELSWLD